MKKAVCLIMTVVMCMSVLTCCGSPEPDGMHTLYIRADSLADEMIATFFNSESEQEEKVAMKKIEEGDDYRTFMCTGDTRKYNMVYLTYNGRDTNGVAFNEFVNGWYISMHGLIPYTQGKEIVDRPEIKTEIFEFMGQEKEVYIWTPDDYDANSEEKYSTIYLFDGQKMLIRDFLDTMFNGCWNVAESVTSMMAESDNKAIVVAIATTEATRYDELVPEISEDHNEELEKFSNLTGDEFSDFINDELVPFIEENYNVYTDAEHTSIAGSSLGGLEAFYVGFDHPETFGTVGAMSSTFGTYDLETWYNFLSGRDFETYPCIYLYSGSMNGDNGDVTHLASTLLQKLDYPEDKLYYHYCPDGLHRENYWRFVFPEFLVAMFDREALIIGR